MIISYYTGWPRYNRTQIIMKSAFGFGYIWAILYLATGELSARNKKKIIKLVKKHVDKQFNNLVCFFYLTRIKLVAVELIAISNLNPAKAY